MGYCTLAIEFFWLKNYTSYYYINSFSLLRIFFSLILFVASFFLSSPLPLFFFFFFSLISVASFFFFPLISVASFLFFLFFSPLYCFFFSLILSVASQKRKKRKKKKIKLEKKKRAAGMFLNLREKKKIKERVGWVEICWTCVWRRKTRKKKWKRMDENELNERKNNIKNKKS